MRKLASDLWTGLRTGPARAGLAFFSLALGLFAATILLSTLDALRLQARELVRHFGAGAFALARSASETDAAWNRRHVDFFRENLGAAAAISGVKELPAAGGLDFAVRAADEELARARGWRFTEGRALDALDVRQGARHAVASTGLFRRNGWRVGDLVLLGHEPFRLVGRFEAGGEEVPGFPQAAVYVPHTVDALETGNADARRRVDVLLFRAAEGVSPEALRLRVAALLGQPGAGGAGVEWMTPESLLQGIRRWQRAIGWTAGVGGALGLLLGAATLAGMLLTGVRERIPEIGLRRALGARRREIAALFVAEALALTFAAAVAGMLAAESALRGLGGRFPLPFHFGAGARLLPLALAGAIALLCSVGPAWMAARLPPAEALRNE
ncbi:MAG: FtsX-like permease family protein [Kiritimatiellia bacterium]